MITADQWYDPHPELLNYYQGDVLSNFPFPALPTFLPAAKQEVWGVLRPRDAKGRPIAEAVRNLPNLLIGRAAKDWPDVWTLPDGEHVIAGCKAMFVLLLSRSCDIDKLARKHFLVAPVIAVTDLQPAQRTPEKLRDLRNNDIFHWFYLPAKNPNMPESFADLTQIASLHRSFFDAETLEKRLIARLSSLGTASLQKLLSDFYGTKFGFVATDVCPQTARYSCSSCFYAGQPTIPPRDVAEGAAFGDCDLCGANALWVKIPVL